MHKKWACALGLMLASFSGNAQNGVHLDIQRHGLQLLVTWILSPIMAFSGTNISKIFPDCQVQRSGDLKTWTNGVLLRGGLGLGSGMPAYAEVLNTNHSGFFIRVLERVSLPYADLSGLSLVGANLTGANLTGANLAGVNLRGADLSHASLPSANLRQANLSSANLSYADLTGADLSSAVMTDAAFLCTTMPDGSVQTDDSDALLLALKSLPQLLPSESLYLKFRQDIAAIRSAFPEVASVHCLPAWVPGQLVTTLGLSTSNIDQLNQSEFGPVTVSYLGFSSSLIVFKKPYNPNVLAPILESRFGIWSEPNSVGGDGQGITVDDSSAKYTFYRGWGDCSMGCSFRHYWDFQFEADGVHLIRQYGDPLPATLQP